MAAGGLILGSLLVATAAVVTVAVMADDHRPGGSAGGGGAPPTSTNPATLAASMSCDQAIAIVQGVDPTLGKTLANTLSSVVPALPSAAPSMRTAAISLEATAGEPQWSVEQRAAFLKTAACLRARADQLEAANKPTSGGDMVTLAPSGGDKYSAAANGVPPPPPTQDRYLAAPVQDRAQQQIEQYATARQLFSTEPQA